MLNENKKINIESNDDLEKIEEEIIKAAEKSGKKNVIVNIFSYPHEKLKKRWQVRYKFNKKHLVMDAIIAGIVLTMIGLNVFWLYGGFHYFSDNLTFCPQQVTSLKCFRNEYLTRAFNEYDDLDVFVECFDEHLTEPFVVLDDTPV